MILFIAIIVAFLVTFILLPIIIKVSKSIDLLDIPDRRKVHHVSTPSLGGIAIFAGFALSAAISLSFAELAELKYFIAGVFIIFILGVRDDM
jgi:UDP-GlcNAc:undecaprenyl-phosphate/decaprenyl-phosphate GlcNAc-1-phosphate transferase